MNVNWSCTQTEERLSDYLDGLLAVEDRREFDLHVASCSRCAPLVRQVGGVVGRLRALEPLEVPSRLLPAILDQTLGPRKATKEGQGGLFGWLRPVWQPRYAMGAVTVMATLLILFQALGVRPSALTAADFNPANLYRNVNRRAHLVYARGAKFVNDLRVVYEIQSRLRLESPPVPVPEPEASPTKPNPQQKSERDGKPGRSAIREPLEFAAILIPVPRSLR
jgi:anti-sigma factor RsiW